MDANKAVIGAGHLAMRIVASVVCVIASCTIALALDMDNAGRIPQVSVLASGVPAAVLSDFNRLFKVNGAMLVGKAANACVQPGTSFSGIRGWYKLSIPLDDTARMNGAVRHEQYRFVVRFWRSTASSDWAPITADFASDYGGAYAVDYELRKSGVRLTSLNHCL